MKTPLVAIGAVGVLLLLLGLPHTVTASHRSPTPTPTSSVPTPTPAPTSTSTPLIVDTASEGYSCSNGVCVFPSGSVGTSYQAPITSEGGSGPTPYTWSVVAGSLPSGLSLTPSYGVYSAYVYGTPTKAQTSAFTLQVRDGVGDTAQKAFTLTIDPPAPLAITFPNSCCPTGTIGPSYLQNFFASGGIQPYTWSIASGQLPPGLSLAPSPPASISGTPTTAGTFTFIVRLTDSTGSHADEKGSITVS
jgi:Putative Ig domain